MIEFIKKMITVNTGISSKRFKSLVLLFCFVGTLLFAIITNKPMPDIPQGWQVIISISLFTGVANNVVERKKE